MPRWGKNKQVDERVTNLQNKIYKEIHMIVMVLSFVSIGVKSWIYGININLVITELVIIVLSGFYYMIRSSYLGVITDEIELHDRHQKMKLSTKNIVVGLILGVVIAIIFATNSAVNYADDNLQAIYYFLLVFFVSFMFYVPVFAGFLGLTYLAAKKKSEQIVQQQLGDEDAR
ncbi:DUF6773 family protein [Radiobacillus sp. PE A8.2]|uniref:DUF6773 family protein n=1 Tax=Radiobacillus sp. PE A8.2 TaxID=3380349 RepID=UPI00388ECE1C